ncbi:MAG TPA: hypothetical protein VMW20_07240 [Candidatus Nanoarchaeia archaeon]|nr:hypothetical protein [Candidatus Nanoarchaeia archaeon]
MSVLLHKEHGLNPTVNVCFFCNEDKGEVVLLGRAYKGKAPMRMITDYVPCEECQEKFSQGVLFIEVTRSPNTPDQPPLYRGDLYQSVPYPTGRYWVLSKDAVRRIIGNDSDTGQKILKESKALIDPETAEQLGLYNESITKRETSKNNPDEPEPGSGSK